MWGADGVTVLGTHIGTEEFVTRQVEERLADEERLWDAIPTVQDVQCAWQILLQCADPNANHLLRTVPPT